MRLYHGSQFIVENPEYGKGKPHNDYGRGFYCTQNIELAKEWVAKSDEGMGFVNCYELNPSGLDILRLNDGTHSSLEWLALLAQYRTYWQNHSIAEEAKEYLKEHFLPDISYYDVIVGFRADDSYFAIAQDFIMGAINLEQPEKAFMLGNLGEQIVLKSPQSFRQIAFMEALPVDVPQYFMHRVMRDRAAQKEYRKIRQGAVTQGLLLSDIIRERMTKNDPRLPKGLSVSRSEKSR